MIVAVDFAAAALGPAALGTAALGFGLGRSIFPRPHIRRINTFGAYFTRLFGANGKATLTHGT